jgi:predicted nucleic acid-binding protein
MRVLVDTSVWSLALRRRPGKLSQDQALVVRELKALMDDDRVVMVGPVRQEILSGIRDRAQFERLRERLSAWPDGALETADFERAAEAFNACRAAGINGTPFDLLLCAWAERRGLPIFTTDTDFPLYATAFPVALHPTPASPAER